MVRFLKAPQMSGSPEEASGPVSFGLAGVASSGVPGDTWSLLLEDPEELGLALVRGGPSKLWFRMLMSCSAWDCQFPGRRCPPVWKAPDCDCQ